MNDKELVDGEYLKELHITLNKKGNKLNDIKNEILLPTLKNCGTLLTNPKQLDKVKSIKTKINEVNEDIKDLTNQLENLIIPGYEETTQSIQRVFNIDFHEEMNEYLKVINTK